jgi:hypothetical protein
MERVSIFKMNLLASILYLSDEYFTVNAMVLSNQFGNKNL